MDFISYRKLIFIHASGIRLIICACNAIYFYDADNRLTMKTLVSVTSVNLIWIFKLRERLFHEFSEIISTF